ncbi:hypothetical protein HY345_03915 [Candidatus Microgenomates bacterium]|nr:hypothetical protein [Candidatus Microgenomates bacterium]
MIKPIVLANASTAVSLVIYVACRILSLLVPDLLFVISQSWFHTFGLGSSKEVVPLDIVTFLIGGITVALLVWVSVYAVALLYNKWSK